MNNSEQTAPTGHIIGATYRSKYWGGTYRVVGAAETAFGRGVEVECIEAGAGAHNTPGERWTHCTRLDTGRRADTRIA